jgi:PAS domain S-box-containing protein
MREKVINKTKSREETLSRFTKLSTLMDKCFFSALLIVFLAVTALFTFLYFEADKKAFVKVVNNAKTADITVSTLIKAYFSSLKKLNQDFLKTGLISNLKNRTEKNDSQKLKYILPILNAKFIRYIFFISPEKQIINSMPSSSNNEFFSLHNMPEISSLLKPNTSFPAISKPFTSPFPFKTIAFLTIHRNELLEQDGYVCFVIDFKDFAKYICSSPYLDKENEQIWILAEDKNILINSNNLNKTETPQYILNFLNTGFSGNSLLTSYIKKNQTGHNETVYAYFSKIKVMENTNWIICAEAYKNSAMIESCGFPVFYGKSLIIFCALLLVLMFVNRYFIRRYITVLEYAVDTTSIEKEKIEKTLSSIIETFPYILFETDKKGRFTFINAPGTPIEGFTPDAMKGKFIFDYAVLAENELKRIFNKIVKKKETVKQYRLEMKFSSNADSRFMSLNITPIFDKHGHILAIRGLMHDITERVKLETHLVQARKQDVMSMIISGIAHDFNNYIGSLLGYIELIKQGSSRDEMLGKLEKTARKAAQLTGQLLSFSRKKNIHNTVCVNLNETFSGIIDILKISLPKSIKLDINIEKNLPSVHTSAFQIEQIVMNLIINAKEAMPSGGVIKINAWPAELSKQIASSMDMLKGQYVILKISDTGEGLNKDMQKKIFEPYFTTKDFGTGIGLASVRILVKNCGGNILVKSKHNKGTEFAVYLPAIDIEK